MNGKIARIGVILASKGRPKALSQWKENLEKQTVAPHIVVYSACDPKDVPEYGDLYQPSLVIFGDVGLTKQRNLGIDKIAAHCDIVAFFDDDYIPERECLKNIVDFMEVNKDVVGATGLILKDGINGPEISHSEALDIIHGASGRNISHEVECDLVGLYGCNMVYRANAIKELRFDENLPLYSWQEDIDFAARVKKYGRIVKTHSFAGVHQGIKAARTSGKRFGYSQIANPSYLVKKGTMPVGFALKLMSRNIISNHLKIFSPEPWIDRRGRAAGNWIALFDLVLSKIHPENILKM